MSYKWKQSAACRDVTSCADFCVYECAVSDQSPTSLTSLSGVPSVIRRAGFFPRVHQLLKTTSPRQASTAAEALLELVHGLNLFTQASLFVWSRGGEVGKLGTEVYTPALAPGSQPSNIPRLQIFLNFFGWFRATKWFGIIPIFCDLPTGWIGCQLVDGGNGDGQCQLDNVTNVS